MSPELYHKDQYRHTFTASVLECLEIDGMPAVILTQTAFYPASGGQPYDTGTLNDIRVLEVRETDDHRIVHLLKQPVTAKMVEGRIDWERRFDHMQQHTGQHLLSQACMRVGDAETLSFHLGDDSSTIDVTRPNLSHDHIAEIELLANRIICENRPVRVHWVTKEELSKLPVRKTPTVDENIRVVEIDAFDFSPCGGTHCARTGELGLVKISRWENYKGGTRLHFLCGLRAFRDYQQKTLLLKELSDQLTTGEADLPALVGKLSEENKTLRKDAAQLSAELLRYEATTLLAEYGQQEGMKVLTRVFDNRSHHELKALATAILDQASQTVVLFGSRVEGKAVLVFSRTQDLMVNMNNLMNAACKVIHGRGGGSPHQAQGGGSDAEKLDEALQQARTILTH